MRVVIEGLDFDSAHYTSGITKKCRNLHGHTFTVDVEVKGEVKSENGMVVDFGIVKKTAKSVIEEWDHKFLVPEDKIEEIELSGPFNISIKPVKGSAVTTENIASNLAEEISEKIEYPVRVRVYEGKNKYVLSDWTEK